MTDDVAVGMVMWAILIAVIALPHVWDNRRRRVRQVRPPQSEQPEVSGNPPLRAVKVSHLFEARLAERNAQDRQARREASPAWQQDEVWDETLEDDL